MVSVVMIRGDLSLSLSHCFEKQYKGAVNRQERVVIRESGR